MLQRSLRPNFSPTDQKDLMEALAQARSTTLRCSSAAAFGSERYQSCHAVVTAIDQLAGCLTGNRELFWTKPHGGGHGTVR